MVRAFILYAFFAIAALMATQGTKANEDRLYLTQATNSPPYEERLLRLSEIIGSVHFLTLLCTPEDGQIWLEQMNNMLEAEAPDALRRARLVERFNSGFRGFQATYRQCTPSANTALNRYIGEARLIVKNLTSDFSG